MFEQKVLIIHAILCLINVESFTIQQIKDGQVYATECMIKVGLNPLTVGQLATGDLSKNSDKVQVSFSGIKKCAKILC